MLRLLGATIVFMHEKLYNKYVPLTQAVATSPAGPVLTGPLFLKAKIKLMAFYKKQVVNKSARVIFSLSIGLL